mgnify:CR=1 FL=1
MTANKDINKYLRQTSRKLCCSKSTKEALMQGFGDELEDHDLLDYNAICQAHGSPAEAASFMMEDIDEGEIRQHRRKRRFQIAGVLVALVVVIGVLGSFAADAWSKFYQPGTTVVVTDELRIVDEQELPDGTADNIVEKGYLP